MSSDFKPESLWLALRFIAATIVDDVIDALRLDFVPWLRRLAGHTGQS